MIKAAISWSGGKDSCAAYHRARSTYDIVCALTMFTSDGNRSRSHGLRPEIVRAQTERLGLTSVVEPCEWSTYDIAFDRALERAAAFGVTHVIFGDILYDEHRAWAERLSSARGLIAVEPLWRQPTDRLFHECMSSGIRARIVTIRQSKLDASFLGQELTEALLPEFSSRGVDPCGENGEYHTMVFDCPAFSQPLKVRSVGTASNSGCLAEDVVLDE